MKHSSHAGLAIGFSSTRHLDHATIIGGLCAFGLVAAAILLGKNIKAFLDVGSLLIVVGGTLGGTLIAFSLGDVSYAINLARTVLFEDSAPQHQRLNRLLELARRMRSQGALSLEQEVYRERDPFLVRSIEMLADNMDPEDIKRTLDIEIASLEARDRTAAQVFQTMGMIAPAMGLIGTLIGLVSMLEQLDNPSAIGPAMALALLTTLYGALLSNLLFLPLSAKLKSRSSGQALLREMTIEGVLCIVNGLNPRLLEERLICFVPPEKRALQYG